MNVKLRVEKMSVLFGLTNGESIIVLISEPTPSRHTTTKPVQLEDFIWSSRK
jgi:hypothetical protein